MASDTEYAIYKAVLEVLCKPEAITALGGGILAAFAYFNKRVKTMLKRIITALYKFIIGNENKEEDKKGLTDGEPHVLTEQFSHDTDRIQRYLDDLQDMLECSRVSILQFHNGARFSLSNPVFKCSTSFESISAGFAPSAPIMKDMLVSIYTTLINPLMLTPAPQLPGVKEEKLCKKPTEGCELADIALRIISYTRDDLRPGPVRMAMHELGMEKMFAILLSVPEKGPVGILTIQYHMEEEADKLMQTNVCEICKIQKYVQSILYQP